MGFRSIRDNCSINGKWTIHRKCCDACRSNHKVISMKHDDRTERCGWCGNGERKCMVYVFSFHWQVLNLPEIALKAFERLHESRARANTHTQRARQAGGRAFQLDDKNVRVLLHYKAWDALQRRWVTVMVVPFSIRTSMNRSRERECVCVSNGNLINILLD